MEVVKKAPAVRRERKKRVSEISHRSLRAKMIIK
jgi:hypothetical protein